MGIKFIDVEYKNIFKKINLELEENKIISIVGKNGSGKTTFLNLVFALDTNIEGKIKIDNSVIHSKIKNNTLEKIKNKIFYLKQDYYNQLFNVNILEDIKYFNKNFNIEKIKELLKMFNLDEKILKKPYTELSSGELKKVLLIIMFNSDKKILILDDATAGLDFKCKKNLIKLLKKEKRNGKLILLSSIDANFLLSVSDEFIYINQEEILKQNNKYDFFVNKTLLNKCELKLPKILEFKDIVLNTKKIKLLNRDNINDLIKDIYRNAK